VCEQVCGWCGREGWWEQRIPQDEDQREVLQQNRRMQTGFLKLAQQKQNKGVARYETAKYKTNQVRTLQQFCKFWKYGATQEIKQELLENTTGS
jgi:hypothetical protein